MVQVNKTLKGNKIILKEQVDRETNRMDLNGIGG